MAKRKKKKKEEDYDELYPDELKESGKILTTKDLLDKDEEIEEEEKEEKKEALPNIEDIPTTGDIKQDIINRLDGISEIARRANDIAHSEKIIRLSNECKVFLEKL